MLSDFHHFLSLQFAYFASKPAIGISLTLWLRTEWIVSPSFQCNCSHKDGICSYAWHTDGNAELIWTQNSWSRVCIEIKFGHLEMWLVQILYAFFVSVSQDLPQPQTFSYIFILAAPFYDPLVCRDPRIYCHILDIHLHLHHYYFHGFLEHVSPISFANRSEVTTPTRKLVGLRTVVFV